MNRGGTCAPHASSPLIKEDSNSSLSGKKKRRKKKKRKLQPVVMVTSVHKRNSKFINTLADTCLETNAGVMADITIVCPAQAEFFIGQGAVAVLP